MQDFSQQLIAALQDYSNTSQEAVEKILDDVSKEARSKLRTTSPKRTGAYKKGWTVTIEKKDGRCVAHIHNKQYRLTHLLENGHRKRNGGFVAARSHIAAVNEWAANEAQRRIEEAFRG